MVVGFNHNFRYKGTVYHVQTEDGGIKFPSIITHLFIGGTILKTAKTSYADIIKSDRLEQVVEELMKEQHRDMLRRLRMGEFDPILAKLQIPAVSESGAKNPEPSPKVSPVPAPISAPNTAPAAPAALKAPAAAPGPVAANRPTAPSEAPPVPPAAESSLDDIILSYLLGEKNP